MLKSRVAWPYISPVAAAAFSRVDRGEKCISVIRDFARNKHNNGEALSPREINNQASPIENAVLRSKTRRHDLAINRRERG